MQSLWKRLKLKVPNVLPKHSVNKTVCSGSNLPGSNHCYEIIKKDMNHGNEIQRQDSDHRTRSAR